MRVAVVAEYYPRSRAPVLGIWAHRQALAARDAGADVEVLVLHRLLPPRSAVRERDLGSIVAPLRQPWKVEVDGLCVRYVPVVSPPRSWSWAGSLGSWATPSLLVALRALRRSFRFDLVHAHYAAPAGDAVRRSHLGLPFVVSAHGGDLYSAARQSASGEIAVRRAFASARLVLANSTAIEEQCKELGATATRVVHLGTDVPRQPVRGDRPAEDRRIVTVANLVARKRHEDVLRAISLLRDVEPQLRWLVVGDGPERHRLEDLARRLELADRVEFRGALPHQAAVDAARSADVFVLPSVQEAFGVAYVEAMAGGVPVVGCRGEPGPEEIARCGGGVVLVPPHEPRALAAELGRLFADPHLRDHLGGLAHRNALDHFTWEACGRETYTAYTDALSSQ